MDFLYESLLIRISSSEYNNMSHIKSPTIDYSLHRKKTVVLKMNSNKHLSRFIPKTTVFFRTEGVQSLKMKINCCTAISEINHVDIQVTSTYYFWLTRQCAVVLLYTVPLSTHFIFFNYLYAWFFSYGQIV